MSEDQKNSDANESAARVVREATAAHEAALAGSVDLQSAWADWSRGLQNVDERALTRLRAAFEAGWNAGRRR